MPSYIFKNNARGGYYYGHYTNKAGKQVQFSCRTKSRIEAQRYYHKKMQQILAQEEQVEKNIIPLLSVFASDFLTFCENAQPVYAPATTAAFRNALRMLLKHVGDLPLDKYTVEICQKFIYTYPASVHTRRKLYAHLRSALNFAVEWGRIQLNPFTKFKKPRNIESEYDIFASSEIPQLCSALDDDEFCQRRMRRLIVLAYETGARLSELLFLDRAHINLAQRIIMIASTTKKTTKSKRNRALTLSDMAYSAVREQLLDNMAEGGAVAQSPILFPSLAGTVIRVDDISRKFTKLARKVFPARPLLHFHSLRHSFGTRMGDAGIPGIEIKQYMGHSSLAVTERYMHPREGYYPNISKLLGKQSGL